MFHIRNQYSTRQDPDSHKYTILLFTYHLRMTHGVRVVGGGEWLNYWRMAIGDSEQLFFILSFNGQKNAVKKVKKF